MGGIMGKIEKQSLSIATDLTGARRIGSDEFFYDLFGVNIKGLKSIWTLIRRPVEYFEAATLPDWGGEHWPSIRIWLGIMGLLVALQFLWASESSEMTAMFQMLAMVLADSFQDAAATDGVILNLDELDRETLGKQAFKRWIFIYPFFFIAAMCALAFIFRAWKPAVSFVIRIRYIFAIIIPGSVFGLLTTLGMVNFTGQIYMALSVISMPIIVCLYAVTAYRGPFFKLDRGERIGLSLVVAILIMTFLFIAQFISMIIAVVPTWIEVLEVLQPQVEAAKAAKEQISP
jgi:hypothetical protein